jgi:plastocyanin
MRRSWVALAASIVLLPGCGDSDEPKERAVNLPPGQPLRVAADEYSFDPNRVTVAEPGALRITLRNEGRLAHDLRIERGGRDIGGTPVFQAGERTARVQLSRGRYEFICTVGDHAKLGMTGTLEVR